MKLSDSFFAYVGIDDEENDEAQLAALGCLGTIKKILSSKLSQEAYHKALDILLPILNYTFSEEHSTAFFADGIGCLNGVLFNMDEPSEKIWHYYLVLNYIVTGKPKNIPTNLNLSELPEEKKLIYEESESGYGPEHIEHMIGSFQYYIYKGKGLLLQAKDPAFNETYLELLFKTIEKTYEVNKQNGDDVHVSLATALFISVLENCKGLIDAVVPIIIEKCLILLKDNIKNKTFVKILVQIVKHILW